MADTEQRHIWMRAAAEFDQRGMDLPHHAMRRRADAGRWIYDEATLCGRPVPKGFGLSLGMTQPTNTCERCLELLGDVDADRSD